MDSALLIDIIRGYCRENANEANVVRYSRYFKGEYNAHGLTQPQINFKARELAKTTGMTLQVVLDAAPLLMESKKYEETGLFLLMLKHLHKQFTHETFNAINTFYAQGIHNWAHADTLGMLVLPLFVNKGLVELSDFKPWIRSPHKFQRRSVPVTLIKSLKTAPDYNRFFLFLESLMQDPEREVHQGMGWFLREAWKRKPLETEAFLLKWKDRAPRLIIQYATEKMIPEEKLRFRREKR